MTPDLLCIRERLSAHAAHDRPTPHVRRAAVAAIFRELDSEPEILLIKRADREDDPWSGHMAFPGGHVSQRDRSARHAAERETWEEIGLDLRRYGQLMGVLNPERPSLRGAGLVLEVVPLVYELKSEPPEFALNHEVAEVHWTKIGSMLRHENLSEILWTVDGRERMMPGFDVNGRVVWGITFRMLNRLFAAIHPEFQPLA